MSTPSAELLIVLCTFPSAEAAEKAAQTLVNEGLCACVSILPDVRSVYRWKGKLETSREALCFLKTQQGCHEALQSRLASLHPYEVPELVTLHPSHVNHPYLAWVLEETAPEREKAS